MKKLLATAVAFLVFATGCTNNPTPQPSNPPTSVPSVEPSETPTDEPITPPQNDPEPTNNPDPSDPKPGPTPTTEEPPATQFLKRWGQQFPGVQEATIMSTAAVTCSLIKDVQDWETNSRFTETVQEAMVNAGFGEVSTTTAASFAVDANQNVCPVVG